MCMSTTFSPARIVAGIDPGLASGGFVVIDRANKKRVLTALALVEKAGAVAHYKQEAREIASHLGGWSDIEFLAADLRARAWMARFVDALNIFEAAHSAIDVFAVESFVDQAQHARKIVQKRWQTPFVIGMLVFELAQRGVTPLNGRLVYQDAGRVLKQFSAERARLAARRKNDRDVVVPGDRYVTNEHKRSALSHALSLSLRLPPYPAIAPTP
jgi:hypothetical protein